ncbi:MAG: hypothetical protein HOP17_07020, partial [Acidobacteria bacterium]|nr:hypothetical protein [Acidobacteriota bacterium]
MKNRFNKESEILDLVGSFEEANISRDDWRHAEHLTVALFYLTHHDYDTAAAKMRDGIFNLLRNGFNVDLTKEMPYHETLTVFWMRTVADFNAVKNGASLLDKANELVATYHKDYPLRFYSREFLFSEERRRTFAPGDLTSKKRSRSLY